MDNNLLTKFWSFIEKTDHCWNWKGYFDRITPALKIAGKRLSARRLSLQIAGAALDRKTQVFVSCGNGSCVNPAHLLHGNDARFWNHVQKLDDCWIWTGWLNRQMYGKFKIFDGIRAIPTLAHRYSWQLYTGRTIPDNIQVCHTCDHPYCVNPLHLFLGTNLDNIQDKIAKGRQQKGSKVGTAKLSEEQVKKIRELSSNGLSQLQLSNLFGIGVSNIGSIIRRETWKHV